MNLWQLFLIFLTAGINLTALYMLLKDGNKPYRIWAWLMTIFSIPILGGTLFFTFGLNRRRVKLFNAKELIDDKQIKAFLKEYKNNIEPFKIEDVNIQREYKKLISFLENANNSPLTFNNEVTILNNGEETFEAIFKACEAAKNSIYIEYYIYENGKIADRLSQIFIRKLKEGVTVNIIYDGLGSWSLSKDYINKLKQAGAKVFCFQKVRLVFLARTNYRNHRKILVVDNEIGFTGGINIDDKYLYGDKKLGTWADTHLQIKGMAVNFLKFIFFNDWYFVSGENLFTPNALCLYEYKKNVPTQIVASGPDLKYAAILNEYISIINGADDYVYIANPYLIPPESLLLALKSAAMSGVDIRIIVPEKSDSVIVKWAVRSYFETLLESGVKIYLYQPGFLHSKIILSDDTVCSIGTANLDIRSFEQNFEVNAIMYHEETTLKLKEQFFGFLEDSEVLTLEKFQQRKNIDYLKENFARLVSPLI
ncbi:cardiolipin synthase [Maribacter hydrothermalis]|uniref:Cardiolipin synthase n=2 Tax=Maribacter hydrothermalis TaxID=1836467 RepID=A0A1B7Z4D1_9FLAO|nr:cardiolipin synthase [Maribacter hydrothermalis]OBR37548.1 cardiolipin synthase [Maribacter hydrothermalis]